MPDYQKAKIYKIVDANEEMLYVGSTVNTLARRLAQHKGCYKKEKKYFTTSHIIFDKYGMENCKILLLENCPCNSKEELSKREGEFIRELNCVNKQVAGRNHKEYLKEYRENNKEVLAEKAKKYREDNKEYIQEYCDANKEHRKEQHKIWRDANKEHLKEYRDANRKNINEAQKIYRNKNKDLAETEE